MLRSLRALTGCLLLLPAAAGAEAMTPAAQEAERQACLARLEGRVEDPQAACACMVAGLTQSLSEADYEALTALLHEGLRTPEGEAAQETARALAADCMES